MAITESAGSRCGMHGEADPDLKELVLGLHWDPPEGCRATDPVDLDVLCVMFDDEGNVLEVIHSGHPRNADHGVIHTGDSRTGASVWDDERIFVFLDSLPRPVVTLDFVVISGSGHPFEEARGAFCHLSDRVSEHEWLRIDLTPLSGCTAHTVATLQRQAKGWRISGSGAVPQEALLDGLRALVDSAKKRDAFRCRSEGLRRSHFRERRQ